MRMFGCIGCGARAGRVTSRAGWGFDPREFGAWKPEFGAASLGGTRDDAVVVCMA